MGLLLLNDLALTGSLWERADKGGLFNGILLLLLSLAFCGLGHKLIRRFKIEFHSAPETWAFSYGLGLVVISYATLLLGGLGLLYRGVFRLGVLNLYISHHKIIHIPTNYYAGFPFGMEMIYLYIADRRCRIADGLH